MREEKKGGGEERAPTAVVGASVACLWYRRLSVQKKLMNPEQRMPSIRNKQQRQTPNPLGVTVALEEGLQLWTHIRLQIPHEGERRHSVYRRVRSNLFSNSFLSSPRCRTMSETLQGILQA